ncbi:MAG: putative Na+/H+ antiporter [Humidesulfovibrio sp.]
MIGAVLFAVAILHTFATRHFDRLAHTQPPMPGSGTCSSALRTRPGLTTKELRISRGRLLRESDQGYGIQAE